MTALELIDSIFRRPELRPYIPSNVRRITLRQLGYLRALIEAEGPDEAIRRGAPGSLIWMPKGEKYVLTEDLRGNKHTLTRLRNILAIDSGRLS